MRRKMELRSDESDMPSARGGEFATALRPRVVVYSRKVEVEALQASHLHPIALFSVVLVLRPDRVILQVVTQGIQLFYGAVRRTVLRRLRRSSTASRYSRHRR